ncbi:hypothetical protein [Streptomyces sirii]|uniref:hypothetical protein n=1 Tax=Streptomyces sirii TaxID=3127701 RepID=UPI003D36E2E9
MTAKDKGEAAMAAPVIRTPRQAAEAARLRLDDALRRAGFDAPPSVVMSNVGEEGARVNRVRIPALSLSQAQWLARKLGGQVTRTAQPAASAVRKELDGALRGAGVIAQPSKVTVITSPTRSENRIIPPSLSIGEVTRLAAILEAHQ